MKLVICETKEVLGNESARLAEKYINAAIKEHGTARILLSTGASQFPFFDEIAKLDIDWSKVEMFHLDEYVGISKEHLARFNNYLTNRFVKVVNPGKYHLIDGTKNSTGEVFMDYRNDGEVLNNRNTVMYGHNMNDGTKFGQLKNYKRNGAFYTHNITVITTEAVLTFKPFSFYKTDIYNPYTTTSFKDDKAFADFCVSEQARSMFESKYEFTGGERIITLSTCYGTSATERYCLHAVLVDIAK